MKTFKVDSHLEKTIFYVQEFIESLTHTTRNFLEPRISWKLTSQPTSYNSTSCKQFIYFCVIQTRFKKAIDEITFTSYCRGHAFDV